MKTYNKNGTYTEDGVVYNQFGVCLDCNGGDLECHHQNLIDVKGQTICANCGIVV